MENREHHLSNAVLVSKSLALAQFRCLDCHKAFISGKHLEKHIAKRHGMHVLNVGQPEGFDASDWKLIQVAERLENVLSYLELKALGSNRDSPETTTIVAQELNNCNFLQTTTSEVRKPVSLFTLPSNKHLAQAANSLSSNEGKCAYAEDRSSTITENGNTCARENVEDHRQTVENSKKTCTENGEQEPQLNDTNGVLNQDNIVPLLEQPQTLADPYQIVTLQSLLVNLINKLENVPAERRVLESSCCQTSDIEEKVSYELIPNAKKSVCFSEIPTVYVQDESIEEESNAGYRSSESANIEQPSSFEEEEISVENDEEHHQTVQKSQNSEKGSDYADLTQMNDFEAQYEPLESQKEKQCITKIQLKPITVDHKAETDSAGAVCCEQELSKNVLLNSHLMESEFCYANKREKLLTARSESNSLRYSDPVEFANTKQQILKIVEECVEIIKSKKNKIVNDSKITNKDDSHEALAIPTGQAEKSNLEGESVEINEHVEIQEDEVVVDLVETADCLARRSSIDTVCLRNENVRSSSQGLVLPSAIICKDSGPDIDELSGNSYEQFMKMCSGKNCPQYQLKEQTKPPALCYITGLDNDPVSELRGENNVFNYPGVEKPGTPEELQAGQIPSPEIPLPTKTRPNISGNTLLPHSALSGLKKTEYAVLLRDETSQVQTLIDTLVTDLQRWKNAKRNEISNVIRTQLNETLASNLRLLGIQNDRSISDSTTATARRLLDNRRSKLVKGSSSYFDTLKSAFETEITRIAKSRTVCS